MTPLRRIGKPVANARTVKRQPTGTQPLGHARLPFASFRLDNNAGIELATIHAHRTSEAAADVDSIR
jgi:hypothetical protein